MDQLGIVGEVEVTSVRIQGIKDKNNSKERQRNKGRGRYLDEDLRIGDPKKKVKLSVGVDEAGDKSKQK